MFGGEQEFQEGDRAWPGAAILELPDSRPSTSKRASTNRIGAGSSRNRTRRCGSRRCPGRIQGQPRQHLRARARRFSSGWPPPRTSISISSSSTLTPRMRPGMTAVARIATERVPTSPRPRRSHLQRDGAPVVYGSPARCSWRPGRAEAPRQGAGDHRRRASPRRSIATAPAAPADIRRTNEAPHRAATVVASSDRRAAVVAVPTLPARRSRCRPRG